MYLGKKKQLTIPLFYYSECPTGCLPVGKAVRILDAPAKIKEKKETRKL